ncbi:MAG: DNA-formamidopyrimidine glycosylase family protein [Acidobacteriota bacterium]
MPEGNEIHRWAERHRAAFVGKKMRVEGPNGRFVDAALLDGRKLEKVLAKGKHLGYVFGRDRVLHVHLGRYGDWSEGQMPLAEVKGALRLRMWPAGAKVRKTAAVPSKRHGWYSNDDGQHAVAPEEVDWLELRGASDCSVWTDAQWKALEERLGPDPLGSSGDAAGVMPDDPEPVFARIAKAKTPIAALLMDQEVMSGIGNIYRAELLFRARLDPMAEGRAVSRRTLAAMWKEAIPLMVAGMVDRRIVTTKAKDRPHARGVPLKEEAHYVYRRAGKPCWICGTKILKKELAGRSLYWCPICQAAQP